jgi:hypothetical protein
VHRLTALRTGLHVHIDDIANRFFPGWNAPLDGRAAACGRFVLGIERIDIPFKLIVVLSCTNVYLFADLVSIFRVERSIDEIQLFVISPGFSSWTATTAIVGSDHIAFSISAAAATTTTATAAASSLVDRSSRLVVLRNCCVAKVVVGSIVLVLRSDRLSGRAVIDVAWRVHVVTNWSARYFLDDRRLIAGAGGLFCGRPEDLLPKTNCG